MKNLIVEEPHELVAKDIANSKAFPSKGKIMGMNYEQYLIGQALSGLTGKSTRTSWVAKTAIRLASATILELAKQQLENK